jgi:hypothetical protein
MGDLFDAISPEIMAQLGLVIIVFFALYRVFLVRRKGTKGERLSSLLVAGWEHDRVVEECERREERQRRFYETQLAELRKQSDVRVGEVRGYRDEAMATNAQLLENLTSATRDITMVLRLLDELAERTPEDPADA